MGRDKLANGEQQKIVETHLNSHTVASIDFNAYSRQNLKSHRETRTADRQNGKENRRTKYLIQSHSLFRYHCDKVASVCTNSIPNRKLRDHRVNYLPSLRLHETEIERRNNAV